MTPVFSSDHSHFEVSAFILFCRYNTGSQCFYSILYVAMWYKTLSWGKIHPCSECFYLIFHLQYFISVFSTILGLLSPWTLAWFTGGLGIIRFIFSSNIMLLWFLWFRVLYTEHTYFVFSSARFANQEVKESAQFCLAVTSFPFPQSQQRLYLSIFNGKTPIPFTWSGSVALLYPLGDF